MLEGMIELRYSERANNNVVATSNQSFQRNSLRNWGKNNYLHNFKCNFALNSGNSAMAENGRKEWCLKYSEFLLISSPFFVPNGWPACQMVLLLYWPLFAAASGYGSVWMLLQRHACWCHGLVPGVDAVVGRLWRTLGSSGWLSKWGQVSVFHCPPQCPRAVCWPVLSGNCVPFWREFNA